MKKEIGGYFELEVDIPKLSFPKSENFALLKTGRTSIHYILNETKCKKVFVPYFTCKVVLEPLDANNIEYEFYFVNENLELKEDISLKDGEYLMYVNYFGLKRNYVYHLSKQFQEKLIIDNTHDVYFNHNETSKSWSFNSIRKFFGTPDGSMLFFPAHIKDKKIPEKYNQSYTTEHLMLRKEQDAGQGYPHFVTNETYLNGDLEQMSVLGQLLLEKIPFEKYKKNRIQNFAFCEAELGKNNQLGHLTAPSTLGQVPFSYPYYSSVSAIQHEQLWDKKIFVPKLWKDCTLDHNQSVGHTFAKHVLHIPIDHRYTIEDLSFVIKTIKEIEKSN